MNTDFQNLVKVYEKSVQMNDFDGVPPFYVRCIAELEDFVNDSWEKKKEMNKSAVKSLATLKQRVKKYTRLFEANIRDFREVGLFIIKLMLYVFRIQKIM